MAGVGPHQPGFIAFGGRHQAPLLGVVDIGLLFYVLVIFN